MSQNTPVSLAMENNLRNWRNHMSMREIVAYEKGCSYPGSFFSRANMRFFDARFIDQTFPLNVFITSERFMTDPRAYTVRRLHKDGHVEMLSVYQQFSTVAQAKAFAKLYVTPSTKPLISGDRS